MRAIYTLRSGKTVDKRVEVPEEDHRENIFLGKPESSRKVVEPAIEDLTKNLKENAEREKLKEREESISRREPHREKFQKPIIVEPSCLEVYVEHHSHTD